MGVYESRGVFLIFFQAFSRARAIPQHVPRGYLETKEGSQYPSTPITDASTLLYCPLPPPPSHSPADTQEVWMYLLSVLSPDRTTEISSLLTLSATYTAIPSSMPSSLTELLHKTALAHHTHRFENPTYAGLITSLTAEEDKDLRDMSGTGVHSRDRTRSNGVRDRDNADGHTQGYSYGYQTAHQQQYGQQHHGTHSTTYPHASSSNNHNYNLHAKSGSSSHISRSARNSPNLLPASSQAPPPGFALPDESGSSASSSPPRSSRMYYQHPSSSHANPNSSSGSGHLVSNTNSPNTSLNNNQIAPSNNNNPNSNNNNNSSLTLRSQYGRFLPPPPSSPPSRHGFITLLEEVLSKFYNAEKAQGRDEEHRIRASGGLRGTEASWVWLATPFVCCFVRPVAVFLAFQKMMERMRE